MANVNPVDMFRSGLAFDGEIDIDHFVKIPSADLAREKLDFLRTPRNVHELMRRGYGGPALERMWKAVYRACVSFDIPIPTELWHHARELGVVIPEE